MHKLLQLKGQLFSRKNPTRPHPRALPKGSTLSVRHLQNLNNQLRDIANYWKNHKLIGGALVSVHYRTVVAKSNRLRSLLSHKSQSPSLSVRGARFDVNNNGQKCHVFTHFVEIGDIEISIKNLEILIKFIKKDYAGKITDVDSVNVLSKGLKTKKMSKSKFLNLLLDAYYVERFAIDRITKKITAQSIITIYRTGVETKQLLSQIGINIIDDRVLNQTILQLRPDEIQKLQDKASYLIAMSVIDFNKISSDDLKIKHSIDMDTTDGSLIPHPNKEPIIGVIDTPFNTDVYFSEWVETKNLLNRDIPIHDEDYRHGTAVCSVIVDGPKGNPELDDGCGRFRVRHFGVATSQGFSAFTLLKKLRSIVVANPDIRVWNISLGSTLEIDDNFISPVAAELDRLQNEYDIIFILAGTNLPANTPMGKMKVGSPADSLNSIVVNSVNLSNKPASYTRVGPVLSFFHKPDVSYYGGDSKEANDKIVVCIDDTGAKYMMGTSFSAPWIARKMAYLIYQVGLTREAAKALLIDRAAGWKEEASLSIGFGIVPKKIDDILQSKNDEISFILTGKAEDYETYTYNLPVPQDREKYPFWTRATLVYFPYCDRNQGVDYTNTEIDLKIGRVKIDKVGKPVIKDIKGNHQDDAGKQIIYEEDARKMYRKWDNVKHVCEHISDKSRPKKVYGVAMWGIDIKKKTRVSAHKENGVNFAIVVTLREMHQVDRYDEFIKLCSAKGWLVTPIDIELQNKLYLQQEETIHWD